MLFQVPIMMMIMVMGGCGGQSNLGNAMILKVLIVYAPSLTLLIIIQEINIDDDDHLENSLIHYSSLRVQLSARPPMPTGTPQVHHPLLFEGDFDQNHVNR